MRGDHDRRSGTLAPPSVSKAPPAAAGADPLSDVLRSVRLTGALFFRVDASWPWSLEIPCAGAFAPIILPRARHIISYHVILKGAGCAGLAGEAPVRFAAGDIVVFPHADAYAMACAEGEPPQLSHEQTLGFFRDMAAGRLPFTVEEGGGGEARAEFVCGFLGCDLRPFNPLLEALPRLLLLRRSKDAAEDLLDRLVGLTIEEARLQRAGGRCVRLGLSELIFVEVVRRYLVALPPDEAGWLAGLRDPGIGRALAALHARTSHAWTLGDLACEAGMSRSVLAERFAALVGCPPMQYLARWRIQRAARLLADGRRQGGRCGRRGWLCLGGGVQPGVQEARRMPARRLAGPDRVRTISGSGRAR